MKIRAAKDEDLDELRSIYYESRLSHFTWTESGQVSLIDYDQATVDERILLIEEKGAIMAFISVYEPDCFIHLLFVKPGYEGKGLGSRLLVEVISESRRPLSLKCISRNQQARSFYESHGFSVVGEGLDRHDEPYVVMEKK